MFPLMRSTKTWVIAALVVIGGVAPAAAHAVPAAPASVSRIGLSSAEYQKAFKQNTAAGLRLVSVSGYVKSGKVRYVGLWRKVGGAPQLARHGLTPAEYQSRLDSLGKEGYTLVSVSPFGVGKQTRFNAIWEKRPSPMLFTRADLTGTEYQKVFDERAKAGMHLVQVNGYTVNKRARYAAIFEGGPAPVGRTGHGMTSTDLARKIGQYSKQGFRLNQLSGYQDQGKDRYAAIWTRPAGGLLRARVGVRAADLQRVGDVERLGGWSPTALHGFSAGSSAKFTMLLETPFRQQDLEAISKAVTGGIAASGVAGASVAIAKDGRLLYAAGFGKANRETGAAMDVRHRLRIGSVSKSITSAAIYQLVEDGKLSSVDRKVFGMDGILGADVKLPATMKALEGASIQQFLQHLSGLRGATDGRGQNVTDPVNCNAGGGRGKGTLPKRIEDKLTTYAKANSPALLGNPGEFDSYSNMSHIIAEAVIEKLSRQTYLDYVRSRVFKLAGLPTSGPLAPALFTIGPFAGKNLTSGEAGHYRASGAYAEYKAENTCGNKPPGVGAGGWAMSAVDLLRWFTSVDGIPGRVPELLTTSNQTAFTAPGVPKFPAGGTYGSGLILGSFGWCGASTPITFGHNGSLRGATSDLFGFPDGYSLAVIVNQDMSGGGCEKATFQNLLDGPLRTVDWPEHDQF